MVPIVLSADGTRDPLSNRSFAVFIALVAIAGCSEDPHASSTTDEAGIVGPTSEAGDLGSPLMPPACSWPPSLNPPTGKPFAYCVAGHALLYCETPGGGGEGCLSNDLSGCSSGGVGVGSSSSGGSGAGVVDSSTQGGGGTCTNQGTTGEYAVQCYPAPALGPQAGTAPSPPAAMERSCFMVTSI